VVLGSFPMESYEFLLILIPLGAVFMFLSFLCLYFRPQIPESKFELDELKKEMDEQFKFSRTLSLSVGILLLSYLFLRTTDHDLLDLVWPFKSPLDPETEKLSIGTFFWITYVACLAHLAILSGYILVRHFREENVVNLSVLQTTFFTMAVLLGLVLASVRIHDQSNLIFDCENRALNSDASKSENQGEEADLPTRQPPPPSGRARVHARAAPAGCSGDGANREFETSNKGDDDPKIVSTSDHVWSNSKMLFWFFLAHVTLFELFWLRRLIKIVTIKGYFQKSHL
jgi:hypothetical protein